MKVRELIEELMKLPQDALVVQSRDGEGNGYSPTSDLSENYYIAESTWAGELWHEDEDGESMPNDAVSCVVLWPTN